MVEGNPGDCDAPVLQRFETEANVTMNALDGLHTMDSLTFNSRGMFTAAINGRIQVCGQDGDQDPGREIRLNAIGRASVGDLVCFP